MPKIRPTSASEVNTGATPGEDSRAIRLVHGLRACAAAAAPPAPRLRDEAAAAVTALERISGSRPVLLTGDNQRAANRLAAEVGITTVHGELLPPDKATAVQSLKDAGSRVLLGSAVRSSRLVRGSRT
jgi:P-type E1-E2 ATPase